MESWFKLSLEVPSDLSDLASGLLFDLNTAGLQVEDGHTAGWTLLSAYFQPHCEPVQLASELKSCLQGLPGRPELLSTAHLRVEAVPQEDWATSWRDFFQPIFPTPRIAICPPWDCLPDPLGGFTITIKPQTAFGTGRHETTRGVIQVIEQRIQTGDRLLDVGTSSGILSIASAKLGAAKVCAVDVDPIAVENARENFALNEVADRIDLKLGSISKVSGRFDLVVSNILFEPLVSMLRELKAHTSLTGKLILGGILIQEETAFRESIEQIGLFVDEVRREGDWICVIAARSLAK